jgi:hypothetical protein
LLLALVALQQMGVIVIFVQFLLLKVVVVELVIPVVV